MINYNFRITEKVFVPGSKNNIVIGERYEKI